MSKVIVGEIEGPSTTSNKITIASGSQLDIAGSPGGADAINLAVNADDITAGTIANARLADGHIIQIKSVSFTDESTFSSSFTNAYQQLGTLTVDITPTSATNKILCIMNANVSTSTSGTIHVRFNRDGSPIGVGDQAGSNRLRDTAVVRYQADVPYGHAVNNVSGSYLDSPATTSSVTYKIEGTVGVNYSGTYIVNMGSSDGDNDYSGRTCSTLTVMEIKSS